MTHPTTNPTASTSNSEPALIPPATLHAQLNERPDTFFLLDVRGADEFRASRLDQARAGLSGLKNLLDHATQIPQRPNPEERTTLEARLPELDAAVRAKFPNIANIQDVEVVIYCRSGVRSAAAWELLTKRGFKHVAHVPGGILAYMEHLAKNRA